MYVCMCVIVCVCSANEMTGILVAQCVETRLLVVLLAREIL